MKIIPIILCGGQGTRLWPLSTLSLPKQFLKLMDTQTLLEKTIRRFHGPLFSEPHIICNKKHIGYVHEILKSLPFSTEARIYIEPEERNTAPAIATLAHIIEKDALVLVTPSDHLIKDENCFIQRIAQGMTFALQDFTVTFGIHPTEPHTGYGYIHHDNNHNVYEFIEKPPLALAKKFIHSKEYLWNSGILLFKNASFLKSLQELQPKLYALTKKTAHNKIQHESCFYFQKQDFLKCPTISIDKAIMEHINTIKVIPSDIGWYDLGDWLEVKKASTTDVNNNTFLGSITAENVENTYIRCETSPLYIVGVKNLIIIQSQDAILITNSDRSYSQYIKKFGQLFAQKHQYDWGETSQIINHKRYKIQKITLYPSAVKITNNPFSHTLILLQGTAQIANNSLITAQPFFISDNTLYTLYNTCNEHTTELLEIYLSSESSPQH